jgi:hypothetical protein
VQILGEVCRGGSKVISLKIIVATQASISFIVPDLEKNCVFDLIVSIEQGHLEDRWWVEMRRVESVGFLERH